MYKFLRVCRYRSQPFLLVAALCPLRAYDNPFHLFLRDLWFVNFFHEKHLYNKCSPLVKLENLVYVYWLFGFSFQWSITLLQQLIIHTLKRSILFHMWRMLNLCACVLTECFYFIPSWKNFIVIFDWIPICCWIKIPPSSPDHIVCLFVCYYWISFIYCCSSWGNVQGHKFSKFFS